MKGTIQSKLEKRLLGAVCAFVLGCILTAGLWPFLPPKNQVSWLDHENGLLFGEYGTLVSSGNLNLQGSGCTVEIWLEPAFTSNSSTILDVYTPETPFKFRLRQSVDDLVILRNYRNNNDRQRAGKLYVDHALRQGNAVLITLAGSAQGTSVYLNGQLAKAAPKFKLTGQDLRGQLIVGAAPVSDDRWAGKLLGLAIYGQQLSAEQIAQHYQDWIRNRKSFGLVADAENIAALYDFSEGRGPVACSKIGVAPDLNIPRRFTVIGQTFLIPPWKEYSPGWSYYKYIIINIAGFVPLGFFFRAYFSRPGQNRRAVLITILLGAATSFTIEVLQAFIPTRQSGLTDVITNSLGTAMGAWLFQPQAVQMPIATLTRIFREKSQANNFGYNTLPFGFLPLCAITAAILWKPLVATLSLALHDDQNTHILLIPPIAFALICSEWRSQKSNLKSGVFAGVILFSAGILLAVFTNWSPAVSGSDLRLTAGMTALVILWIASFVLCFGTAAAQSQLFPLCFLLWMVPLPALALARIVHWLQEGSAVSASLLFTAVGVPVSRDGVQVTIPGLTVEVARECSSIRSSLMLLVTTMVLAHLLLKAPWRKLVTVLVAVPLSVAKNGLRIFTLAMLGTRVDRGFLTGRLHHEGGIVFFLIALAIIFALLCSLRKGEQSFVYMTQLRPAES
jgi:exosortase